MVLITGTLSMQGIIRAQGWAPYHWFLFSNPFCFVAAIVLFISALAEGNRTPFDLPEAESELVAGFATEYSGHALPALLLGRMGQHVHRGALITTLYLGGWQAPGLSASPLVMNVLQLLSFNVKVLFLVFTSMWVRATLPRVRIDQMMSLCWKYFVPIAFINMIGTAVWVAIWPDGNPIAGYVMFALGVAIAVLFIQRVMYYLETLADGDVPASDDLSGSCGETMGAATDYFRHIKDAVVTIFDGMAVSASHLLRRPYTIQYPDRTPVRVQDTLPFRYRGILDVDLEICTGCLACERACPIDCIVIVCEKNAQTRELTISQFDIDIAKCMYCGLCSEPCPTGSIHHTTEFEGADFSLESLIRRYVPEPVVAYKVKERPGARHARGASCSNAGCITSTNGRSRAATSRAAAPRRRSRGEARGPGGAARPLRARRCLRPRQRQPRPAAPGAAGAMPDGDSGVGGRVRARRPRCRN